ncbi:MAG: hypothetical protein WC588_04780 [Candidatus Micrarchaeia archaeon]
MASDKMRALIGFAKLAVAAVAGYAIYYVWVEARGGLDEWYIPYAAGTVVAVMVFVLLSKLNKGND